MEDGAEEHGSLDEDVRIPSAVDVPPRRVLAAGLSALTALLAMVGGAAVLLALGLAALFGLLHAGDPGLNDVVTRFTTAARALPGVRSADARPGLGDLGTTPVDVYGDVRLNSACTATSLGASTRRLRALMAKEKHFQLHPTVWCHDIGMTVSPVAAVTARRLALVRELAADHSLRGAAVVVTQRGDDPSSDVDDTSLQVDLFVRARTSGTVAATWLDRLRPTFPSVTVTATTGGPADHLDAVALQKGQWTVVVRAQDPGNAAILRTAARLQRSSAVLAGYADGPADQVAVIASSWSVLRDLPGSLPGARADGRAPLLTVTLSRTSPD